MKTTLLSVLILFSFLWEFCGQDAQRSDLARFEQLKSEASAFVAAREFDKAENSYKAALQIGLEHGWSSELVYVRIYLAEIYFAKAQYDLMTKQLVEAKDVCRNDTGCSSAALGSSYDALIQLTLLGPKDVRLAREYISEVISQSSRLDTSTPSTERLRGYAADLRAAGFESEAKGLESEIRATPKR